MEEPVEFVSRGYRLRGILHVPERRRCQEIGINLLNPGLKYRVGPHRLNVKLARYLSQRGYVVLRFDPKGIGDSEGPLAAGSLNDLWRQVQKGAFVQDTLAANNLLRREAQVSRLILMGLCGGAITAILAAAQDPSVQGLVLMDVPVLFMPDTSSDATFITSKEIAQNILKRYFAKLMIPKAWLRFLSFKSDYRAILRSLSMTMLRSKPDRRAQDLKKKVSPYFNWGFLEAFEALCARKSPILFVLATRSYTTGDFKREFAPYFLQTNVQEDTVWCIHEILDANHAYSKREWQQELFQKITTWLEEKYRPNF